MLLVIDSKVEPGGVSPSVGITAQKEVILVGLDFDCQI